jgi:hypothetical protein
MNPSSDKDYTEPIWSLVVSHMEEGLETRRTEIHREKTLKKSLSKQ